MRLVSLRHILIACGLMCGLLRGASAEPAFTRTEDVIYGRKDGMALTLDVFTPTEQANGAAVVLAVSGGWTSAHDYINAKFFEVLLKRGYTIIPVVHGSQPRYTVPEVVRDMQRAVRFIRHNAGRFHIDENRIGVMGSSSGGHLSLMLGMTGKDGEADAKDPVDRESSRVQAVACFFPPTDLMNYGKPGHDLLKALDAELANFKAPFDFREYDQKSRRLVLIEDSDRRLQIARDISPITHVTPDDPPTLIIHGDADKLVPFQQAQVMEEKLKEARVPVKLVTKPGAAHGWPNIQNDLETFGDWFDEHLLKKPATRPATSDK